MKYIVLTSIALLLNFSFFTPSAFAADLDGARVGFMLAEKEYQAAKSTAHFKQDQLALVELKFKQISQELADAKAQMALASQRLDTAESTLAAKQKVLDQEWAKTHPN